MKKIVFTMAGAALCICGATIVPEEANRWWQHVEVLASDKLQGREAGSPGYEQAARYVVEQMQRSNLRPAGSEGYLQPVSFRTRSLDEEHTSLVFVRPSGEQKLVLGDDAVFSLRSAPQKIASAQAVFVGYGLKIPEANVDDFAGLDLRGKVVVFLNGAPSTIPGPLAAHARSAQERLKSLLDAGAVGSISFSNPRTIEVPWQRVAGARLIPAYILNDAGAQDRQFTTIGMNPAKADLLFEGTQTTAQQLFALDDQHKPLPRFELPFRVSTTPAIKTSQRQSSNVAGVLPGTDPVLKNQYVVVSAHLDHIGTGTPINGDAIYNGAMDNASGVAALLETARLLSKKKLKRSVLFLAVTGEEKGLLGSKYFMLHPTVPARSLVADLNMDMFLPIVPLNRLVVYGSDESTLGETVRQIAQQHGVTLLPDPEPEKNHFIRSDQYSFILQGIPSLAFKVAADPGTPEDKTLHQWVTQRYHAPSDDLDQPVNYETAAKFLQIMEEIVSTVGNGTSAPRWLPTSYFTRFAQH